MIIYSLFNYICNHYSCQYVLGIFVRFLPMFKMSANVPAIPAVPLFLRLSGKSGAVPASQEP